MPPKALPPAELLGKPFKYPKTLPPDNDRLEKIKQVFEELNRPSKSRLATALKARDIAYTTTDLEEIVRKSTEKQLQTPAYNYKGKITSTGKNERWAIDTIDLTSHPSPMKGSKDNMKYIVVAQDIFTRKIFAEASAKNSPEAVGNIFENFVREHGIPKELNTDLGEEYNNARFTDILKEKKIIHRVKPKESKNDIATIDRAHGTLKKKLLIDEGSWADRLSRVVNGMNNAPHASLADVAPNKVESAPDLTFQLKKRAVEDMAHNAAAIKKRSDALEKTGTFRSEVPPPKGFRRGHQANFSGDVHKVETIEPGGRVTDTKGKSYQTKFAKPVDSDSKSIVVPATAKPGAGDMKTSKQRELMQPFVDQLSKHIGSGKDATLNAAGVFLRGLPNFTEKAREAGINQKSLIANILRLFPGKFTVDTSATGGAATVRVARGRRITLKRPA